VGERHWRHGGGSAHKLELPQAVGGANGLVRFAPQHQPADFYIVAIALAHFEIILLLGRTAGQGPEALDAQFPVEQGANTGLQLPSGFLQAVVPMVSTRGPAGHFTGKYFVQGRLDRIALANLRYPLGVGCCLQSSITLITP